MRSSKSSFFGFSLVLVLACLVVPPAHAETDQSYQGEDYGDAYGSGDYGRVRYEENGLTIVRAETEAMRDFPSSGQVNAPIFPGDSVTTDAEQRTEIQLAGGSVVRIDRDSRVNFLSLPDPYQEPSDHTVLQLVEGTLRVEAAVDEREEFRVDTPACAVYVLGDADIRIEVRGDRTRISSRRGVAEVDTGAGALLVRGGMSTDVLAGEPPQDSRPFNTFLVDDFDRWVAGREERFAVRNDESAAAGYHELPSEVRPYYRELSHHGTWVRDAAYGHVWVPRTTVVGWRPYRHGRWGYGSRGYFWVSYEPWGWAPYHYGRWTWISGHGWSWVPGSVFGGAWVSWSWGPSYVGWCPLDYWNRPVLRAGPTHRGYDVHSWTFVRYDHVARPNSVAHYVGPREVSDLSVAAVVTRPPRVAPSQLSNVEPRTRAIADARAGSRSRVLTAPAPGVPSNSRSFVELERKAGLRREATRRDAAVADREPDPGGRASPGVASSRGSVGRSSLSGSKPGGTTSPSAPAVRRPLVRSDRDNPEGASDRLKDIYRQMARPRPTRSQTPSTPKTSPREDTEKPGREKTGSREGAIRRPVTDPTRDDEQPAQRAPRADSRSRRGSWAAPNGRFVERRGVSSNRPTMPRSGPGTTTRRVVAPSRSTAPTSNRDRARPRSTVAPRSAPSSVTPRAPQRPRTTSTNRTAAPAKPQRARPAPQRSASPRKRGD